MLAWVRQVYLLAWVRQVYLLAWVSQVYLLAWVRQVYLLAWVRQVYLLAWVRQVYLLAWIRQVYLIASVRQVYLIANFHFTFLCHITLYIQHSKNFSHNFILSLLWSTSLPMSFYYNVPTLYRTVFVHSFNMSKPPLSTSLYAVSYACVRILSLLQCHITYPLYHHFSPAQPSPLISLPRVSLP